MGIYEAMDGGIMDAFASQQAPDPADSPELRSWFGNSKVVDDAGNPLPVFHGSESEFRRFDYNFIGDGHDLEGPGFYFTNLREEAKYYLHGKESGKIYEVFLKIENPVPLEGKVNRDEVEKMILYSLGMTDVEELWRLEDADEYWETRLSNWGEHPVSAFHDMVESILLYNNGPHDAFQTIWADAFGFHRSADYLRGMLSIGYDGVILQKETRHGGNDHYVVFSPNNIKAVSSEGFSKDDDDMYKSDKTPKLASSSCRICNGEIIGRCRCPSRMHDEEALRQGHGTLCENGHRVGKDGIYITIPEDELARKKKIHEEMRDMPNNLMDLLKKLPR